VVSHPSHQCLAPPIWVAGDPPLTLKRLRFLENEVNKQDIDRSLVKPGGLGNAIHFAHYFALLDCAPERIQIERLPVGIELRPELLAPPALSLCIRHRFLADWWTSHAGLHCFVTSCVTQ
jgi:hypothetical protein